MPTPCPDPFKGHRFPREIISYAVWLYYRFSLSLRDVETCRQKADTSKFAKPSSPEPSVKLTLVFAALSGEL